MRPEHLSFLEQHHIEALRHSGRGLLDHLEGVGALLTEWSARPELVTAGTFHSVYGTESYTQAALPVELRPQVQALIGAPAERLAWLFGAMTKDSLYANLSPAHAPGTLLDRFTGASHPLTDEDLRDLFELVAANWLEQRPRVAPEHRDHRRAEFQAMLPFLSRAAARAVSEAYGFGARTQ